MSLPELLDRWIARREEFERLEDHVKAARLADDFIADLESLATSYDQPLTYAKAAQESGYSVDHIGRLVREGKLRNVGRKGAPRVLASELLTRPMNRIASANGKAYNVAADVRSLRTRR